MADLDNGIDSFINPNKPSEPKPKFNWIIILTPILIGVCSAIAYSIGAGQFRSEESIEKEEQISKINHVLDVIEEKYVDSIDREELIIASISGMLHDLDPHSAYIPASRVEQANEQLQGHFGGVGVRFIILRDTLMITNVIKDAPAYIAGVQSGDRVVKVDDKEIAGIGLKIEDVHDLLKGTFGSKVTLEVERKGERRNQVIDVIRGLIPLPSIDASFMITKDIGYIRLQSFSDKTSQEFANATSNLRDLGMKKLIFDLRNNGGGYLGAAQNVADEFLKSGNLVVYTEGLHSERKDYLATGRGNFENGDLLILVNSGTASASEIVAGAIQDNDRGLIMGRRTFGKGLVQQPIKLEDGSEMRLTVSRYYTPTGRCIQKPYGNGIDYQADIMERYENGELEHLDSTIFDELEQFVTKKGKIVYGGGGIMPDFFIPIDTIGASAYYTNIMYSSAFRDYCFDYVDKRRSQLNFDGIRGFREVFEVSDEMYNDFIQYVEDDKGIYKDEFGLSASGGRIRNALKAEMATLLFNEEARFYISYILDNDISKAIEKLEEITD